ncbi:pilus assembly protein PilM [Clostridium oryzae]|uniref:Competence protein A n=1 Tax=Clostridium oryzae TaxID=1450648 RepID=A0A1V4IN87_9CLOT|nr:pilus assembly protein PilM [Clostridium oryzae]OPJ61518.1 competence protein A [Clostridium oryzae]
MEKLRDINIKEILSKDITDLKKEKKSPEKIKKLRPLINKKVVSLDIGSQNTKVVVGRYTNSGIVIDKAFMFKTVMSSIYDTVIQTSTFFAVEIDKYMKKNGVKIKDANCTGNSTSIINRELIIPEASGDELDTLIKFELQRYLPLNMDNYIVQYNILEKLQVDEVDKLRVLTIIYPVKLSRQYMELIKNAKLKPNALDINYNVLRKLIMQHHIENENTPQHTCAIIDMGAKSIEVNIYEGVNLEFARIIKSGGEQLDISISKSLNISPVEAEGRKINEGNLLGMDNSELNIVLRDEVNNWIEEIGKIFQFFRNKKFGNNVDTIFIYGGSSRLKGLEQYMSNYFNIPVNRLTALNNVEFKTENEVEDIYINAIGAIIRY